MDIDKRRMQRMYHVTVPVASCDNQADASVLPEVIS